MQSKKVRIANLFMYHTFFDYKNNMKIYKLKDACLGITHFTYVCINETKNLPLVKMDEIK